ncbi:MAG TPA: TolC family protein [Gammaproteobacteria bacterium]|nr:TolC family protein [Gammaproteobacteria bacterium]
MTRCRSADGRHPRGAVAPRPTMAFHGWLAAILMLPIAAATAAPELTLQEAEQQALSADPAILASRSRAAALQEQAVADGQLPDPRLTFGAFNVPTDDFSMKKEGSSQLRTGIKQAFPRGRSLHYRKKRTEWLGKAEQERTRLTQLEIRRDVREAFLELFYQNQARNIIDESRGLFQQLLEITRAHYASGRVSQQDVLQAQLELSRLDDRATRIDEKADVQRARLARWIGDAAWQPIQDRFPQLQSPPSRDQLAAQLPQHPAIRAASDRVEANQQLVKAAREQYKPGFDLGVEYRKRFGDNPDGSNRTDMLAAMVTMDLPIFTGKRQDKRLSASRQQTEAAIQAREQKLREMRRMLDSDYARWQRLGEQQRLYHEHLLRESHDNADAALNAYQSGITEFNTLMRARITELEVRLQDLRVRVDRAKAQARLLFLAADRHTASPSPKGEKQ